MKLEQVRQQLTTPLDAPAYGPGPFFFYGREFFTIEYRTDLQAARRLVPEPLVLRDPIVRFEVVKMPDALTFGAYVEAGQTLAVELDGEPGQFALSMYLENHPAIAGGREVAGFPKKLGSPQLFVDNDVLVGQLDYGTQRVATATMAYKRATLEAAEAKAELSAPLYLLHRIPWYDGRGPRISELLRLPPSDATKVVGGWTGPARLHLIPHVLAPVADLPVLEIVRATHIVADFTYGPLELAHDYLDG